jgi:hypothetical protein
VRAHLASPSVSLEGEQVEGRQLQNALVSWSKMASKEVVSKDPSVTDWVDHDLAVAS